MIISIKKFIVKKKLRLNRQNKRQNLLSMFPVQISLQLWEIDKLNPISNTVSFKINENNDVENENDKVFLVGSLDGNLNLNQLLTNRELLSEVLHRIQQAKLPFKKAVMEITRMVGSTLKVPQWKNKNHFFELYKVC